MSVRHKPPAHILERKRSRGEKGGKKDGEMRKRKEPEPRAGDNVWIMSLLVWNPVRVRARHEAGIPAAVTFPEPKFESTTGPDPLIAFVVTWRGARWSHSSANKPQSLFTNGPDTHVFVHPHWGHPHLNQRPRMNHYVGDFFKKWLLI